MAKTSSLTFKFSNIRRASRSHLQMELLLLKKQRIPKADDEKSLWKARDLQGWDINSSTSGQKKINNFSETSQIDWNFYFFATSVPWMNLKNLFNFIFISFPFFYFVCSFRNALLSGSPMGTFVSAFSLLSFFSPFIIMSFFVSLFCRKSEVLFLN